MLGDETRSLKEVAMLQGHKILLTGITGQVGGALAKSLGPHNDVWGIARFSQPGTREQAESHGLKTVLGDLSKSEFDELPSNFDYVIHSAANTRPGTAEVAMVHNPEATGFLMHHCRHVKAFMHVSNSSLYLDDPDPLHKYVETDHVGGHSPHSLNYGPSKLASEGVVRTLARIYEIPTVIARLNVAYGSSQDHGGLPGILLESLLAGQPIKLPKGQPFMMSLIHVDDMVGHIEPMLNAASVPATIVNWGGDVGVSTEEWIRFMAALIGIEAKFEYVDGGIPPNRILDPTFGRKIGMEWNVDWKEGIRAMLEARHPELELKASPA
jgi:UDP-glucuronate 4-epimerase